MPEPLSAFPDEALAQDEQGLPRVSPFAPSPTQGVPSAFPDGPQDRLTDAMRRAPATPPDTAARIFKLQTATGLPSEVIARNLDAVEKQAASAAFDPVAFRKSSPLLASWLEQHPLNAALTHDDLIPMTAIERTLGIGRNVVGALGAGIAGFSQGVWGAIQAGAEANASRPRLPGEPSYGFNPVDLAAGAAAIAGHMADRARGAQQGAGFTERAAYSGIESVAQMAPGLALSVLSGGESAMLAAAGITTGGQSYAQAREQGVGVGKASAFAAFQGAVEVATEFIPAHRLIGDLAAKAPFLTVLAHQIASEVPTEIVATVLQNLGEWATLPSNKEKTFQDYLKEQPSAIAATVISVIVATGASTIGAHGTVRFLEKLSQQVTDSKTAARSPEKLADFIASATKDGPQATVYAPVDSWTNYWQSKGVDPAQIAADLTGKPDAYAEAVRTGEDLAIPTEAYASKLAGTEHHTFFEQELRLGDPTAMNGREVTAFEADQRAQAEARATATPAAQTPREQIHAQILEQLTQGGKVVPASAEKIATLVDTGIGQLAADAGLDPFEVYQRYGLQVSRPELAGAPTTPGSETGAIAEPASAIATGTRERLIDMTPEMHAEVATMRERYLASIAGPRPGSPGDVPNNPTAQRIEAERLGIPAPALTAATAEAQTAVRGAQPPTDRSVARARRDAGGGVSQSRPGSGESDVATVLRRKKGESDASLQQRRDARVTDLRTARRDEHFNALYSHVLDAAQAQDPNLDPVTLRKEFDFRVELWEEKVAAYRDSGHDPVDLLRAIARAGGIGMESAGGLTGERRLLMENTVAGKWRGIAVFQKRTVSDSNQPKTGHGFDVMVQRLQQDARFEWIQSTDDLIDAIDDAFRHDALYTAGVYPGSDQLESELGIKPDAPWWQDPWNPDVQPTATDAIDTGGDTSFNVSEFGQGLFDALDQAVERYRSGEKHSGPIPEIRYLPTSAIERKEMDFRPEVTTVNGEIARSMDYSEPVDVTAYRFGKANNDTLPVVQLEDGHHRMAAALQTDRPYLRVNVKAVNAKGEKLNALIAMSDAIERGLADVLPTGEVQPRLPGDVGTVRDQNVATPQIEAPFSLTGEVSKGPKGKQDTLFQDRRGSISFGPDRQMTINLFAQADLSTFLHETGHFFLEVFGDLVDQVSQKDPATLTDGQRRLLTNYGALLKELGVENRHEIGTSHHEQFATMFEAYLMEGKAPSVELRSVFANFRAWLLGVYRSLKNLNAPLTDDVRKVFDRMLASDAAIADAEQAAHVAPMFTTAESAGMSPAEFSLYAGTIADASRTAREQLDAKLMAEVRREQTAEWKARRAEIQTAVEAETYQRPEYRALAAMQKGTLPDGSPMVEGMVTESLKLSKQTIVDRYGKERLASLPRPYIYTVEGGMDPDTVARLFGFSSGDHLLTAVATVQPMRAAIQSETDRRMLTEHGSLLLDGTLQDEAKAAVANEDRDAVIRAEMKALRQLQRTVAPFVNAEQQKARRGPATIAAGIPSAALMRDTAKARIAATRYRDLKPSVFWSASRRGAQLAIEAAARQDFAGAIAAKTQELLNLNLYRQAEQAKADIETRVAKAKALGTTAARQRLGLSGATYLEQVDGILDRYEFATVPLKQLDRRARIKDWVEALVAQGLPADELPQEVLDDARRVNWKEATVEELIGITDGLDQILHLSRLKGRLLKAAGDRDFEATRLGLTASIRDKNTGRTIPREFRPAGERHRVVADWFASHAKIAILARALDGHVDGGPMWESVIRPLNAASDTEAVRKRDAGKAMWAIVEQHYAGRELARLNETLYIPAIQDSLSKEGRLSIALNWGNQTSRDRILADPVLKVNESQVMAILDTLDARDWQFVQGTWDYINTFWPEIAAKQERVTGLAPDKVEALEVDTPYGQLKGGYYPLAYDSRKAARAGQHEAASQAKLATAGAYVRNTTRRGHTMARLQNVRLPVRLDLGVAFSHLEQVIHDLTHHETLLDVTRLLRDPHVSQAILETKGDSVYQQFTRAVQDIAVGTSPATNILDKSANWLRTGTQIAGLGWNLWTAAQQPLGLFNGASRVGPVWVARGMKRWMRDAATMQSTAAWIADVSPMMRMRVSSATQDLADLRTQLRRPGGWFDNLVRTVSADHVTQQTIVDGYLWHIGLMQRVADIPTWLGQYEKSMAGGETETRAIALADQAVLDSQGGGTVKDLAQVQRGGPMARLFMTFYSYGSTVFNSTSDVIGATNVKSPAQVLELLGHLSLLYVMPALATVGLSRLFGRSGGDDDDLEAFAGDVGQEMLSTALNTMVLVRELGGLVQDGARGYAGPAGTRLATLLYNLGAQAKQGELDPAFWKSVNAAAGPFLRYPAAQIQRTVDGWIALEEGRTQNPAALLMGAPKQKAN